MQPGAGHRRHRRGARRPPGAANGAGRRPHFGRARSGGDRLHTAAGASRGGGHGRVEPWWGVREPGARHVPARSGWDEHLFALHPTATAINDVPAVAGVAELGEPVDYLLVAVPTERSAPARARHRRSRPVRARDQRRIRGGGASRRGMVASCSMRPARSARAWSGRTASACTAPGAPDVPAARPAERGVDQRRLAERRSRRRRRHRRRCPWPPVRQGVARATRSTWRRPRSPPGCSTTPTRR